MSSGRKQGSASPRTKSAVETYFPLLRGFGYTRKDIGELVTKCDSENAAIADVVTKIVEDKIEATEAEKQWQSCAKAEVRKKPQALFPPNKRGSPSHRSGVGARRGGKPPLHRDGTAQVPQGSKVTAEPEQLEPQPNEIVVASSWVGAAPKAPRSAGNARAAKQHTTPAPHVSGNDTKTSGKSQKQTWADRVRGQQVEALVVEAELEVPLPVETTADAVIVPEVKIDRSKAWINVFRGNSSSSSQPKISPEHPEAVIAPVVQPLEVPPAVFTEPPRAKECDELSTSEILPPVQKPSAEPNNHSRGLTLHHQRLVKGVRPTIRQRPLPVQHQHELQHQHEQQHQQQQQQLLEHEVGVDAKIHMQPIQQQPIQQQAAIPLVSAQSPYMYSMTPPQMVGMDLYHASNMSYEEFMAYADYQYRQRSLQAQQPVDYMYGRGHYAPQEHQAQMHAATNNVQQASEHQRNGMSYYTNPAMAPRGDRKTAACHPVSGHPIPSPYHQSRQMPPMYLMAAEPTTMERQPEQQAAIDPAYAYYRGGNYHHQSTSGHMTSYAAGAGAQQWS